MDNTKDMVKEALKEMFSNDEIRIMVFIEPEHAEKGWGQWNVTRTVVAIDGEKVYEHTGSVEIIEGV
jgi:hypothetical protein